MTEILCSKCDRICKLDEVFTYKDNGKTSYECIDENECKILEKEIIKKKRNMSAGEHLKIQHNINIENLVKIETNFFNTILDGCVRYNDPNNENILYKWDSFRSKWEKLDNF